MQGMENKIVCVHKGIIEFPGGCSGHVPALTETTNRHFLTQLLTHEKMPATEIWSSCRRASPNGLPGISVPCFSHNSFTASTIGEHHGH